MLAGETRGGCPLLFRAHGKNQKHSHGYGTHTCRPGRQNKTLQGHAVPYEVMEVNSALKAPDPAWGEGAWQAPSGGGVGPEAPQDRAADSRLWSMFHAVLPSPRGGPGVALGSCPPVGNPPSLPSGCSAETVECPVDGRSGPSPTPPPTGLLREEFAQDSPQSHRFSRP